MNMLSESSASRDWMVYEGLNPFVMRADPLR